MLTRMQSTGPYRTAKRAIETSDEVKELLGSPLKIGGEAVGVRHGGHKLTVTFSVEGSKGSAIATVNSSYEGGKGKITAIRVVADDRCIALV